jgi:hypothetical protein
LTPDDFIKREFEVFAAKWLLKHSPSERNYHLVGFDASITELDLQNKSKQNHWHHLKSIVKHNTEKIVKWLTGSRFEGHGRGLKCICGDNPTISTKHVLICHRLDSAFSATEKLFNIRP